MEKHNDRIDINSETKANLQSENAGLKEEISDIVNYQNAYEKKVEENIKIEQQHKQSQLRFKNNFRKVSSGKKDFGRRLEHFWGFYIK